MWLFVILAVNVSVRQGILEDSIGAYPEETTAYKKVLGLTIGYPLFLMVATFSQYKCYQAYNGKKHPFKRLIKRDKKVIQLEMKSLLVENDEFTDKRVSTVFNAFVKDTQLQMPKPELGLPTLPM